MDLISFYQLLCILFLLVMCGRPAFLKIVESFEEGGANGFKSHFCFTRIKISSIFMRF